MNSGQNYLDKLKDKILNFPILVWIGILLVGLWGIISQYPNIKEIVKDVNIYLSTPKDSLSKEKTLKTETESKYNKTKIKPQIFNKIKQKPVHHPDTTRPIRPLISSYQNMKLVTETIKINDERTKLEEITPSRFKTTTKSYIAKEECQEGATFVTVTEKVLIREAYERTELSQPKYRVVTKRFLVKLPTKTKKAEYQTITTYELEVDSKAIIVTVPAEYKTVTRQVVQREGSGNLIPPQYGSYTTTVLAIRGETKEIKVPAVFQTISHYINN